jgi:hypothetical protein
MNLARHAGAEGDGDGHGLNQSTPETEAHVAHATTYGSWTLMDKARNRGVEPEECCVFGNEAA